MEVRYFKRNAYFYNKNQKEYGFNDKKQNYAVSPIE